MNEHIVKSYEDELALLDKKVAQMGGLAEHNLGRAFDALEKRDPLTAESVVNSDRNIDALQREIEEQVISMIARRQPMANDLRHVMAAIRISGDLERIGDLAKNIAKRALAIAHEPHPKPLISGFRHMVELALRQLKDVLDAYAARDANRAMKVWNDDTRIDAMYNSIFRELSDLHDGRSTQHRPCDPPVVRRKKHRACRRSYDQHRRDRPLHGEWQLDHRRSSQGRTGQQSGQRQRLNTEQETR